MKEVSGNLWDYHRQGNWVAITTNGSVRKDGACVMGRGVALEAKKLFPLLPYRIGEKLKLVGNYPAIFRVERIITFPVKHKWFDRADIDLILKSAKILISLADAEQIYRLYLVRPGCGNGGLEWRDVKPVLSSLLDNRFIVVERNP